MKGVEALEKLQADFDTKRKESGLKKIDVPEIGDSIYVQPVASSFKKAPILRAFAAQDLALAYAKVWVAYALDKEGKQMFSAAMESKLMRNVDSDVLTRVAGEILDVNNFEGGESTDFELEAAEKN